MPQVLVWGDSDPNESSQRAGVVFSSVGLCVASQKFLKAHRQKGFGR